MERDNYPGRIVEINTLSDCSIIMSSTAGFSELLNKELLFRSKNTISSDDLQQASFTIEDLIYSVSLSYQEYQLCAGGKPVMSQSAWEVKRAELINMINKLSQHVKEKHIGAVHCDQIHLQRLKKLLKKQDRAVKSVISLHQAIMAIDSIQHFSVEIPDRLMEILCQHVLGHLIISNDLLLSNIIAIYGNSADFDERIKSVVQQIRRYIFPFLKKLYEARIESTISQLAYKECSLFTDGELSFFIPYVIYRNVRIKAQGPSQKNKRDAQLRSIKLPLDNDFIVKGTLDGESAFLLISTECGIAKATLTLFQSLDEVKEALNSSFRRSISYLNSRCDRSGLYKTYKSSSVITLGIDVIPAGSCAQSEDNLKAMAKKSVIYFGNELIRFIEDLQIGDFADEQIDDLLFSFAKIFIGGDDGEQYCNLTKEQVIALFFETDSAVSQLMLSRAAKSWDIFNKI
ncbi:hypothetical protein GW590_00635 [Rahnella sp. SAP-1]|uniref:Uncharacterized protein n=1 Tax=Rouxiella aceris TaxID=2703884 RepID=A0A848MBC5_9GAMM|nr:hypothetical protein [Rouxiella aceris]NMP25397.1 hypothetical protein [Rouxiella aceris]